MRRRAISLMKTLDKTINPEINEYLTKNFVISDDTFSLYKEYFCLDYQIF
jgi:hypothetical protein